MKDQLKSTIHNKIHSKNIRHGAEIVRTVCGVLGVTLQIVVLCLLVRR